MILMIGWSVLCLSILYLLFFLYLSTGHFKHKVYKHKQKFEKFSLIVAARNEAQHIRDLCSCLIKQNYPVDCFEIIIVDDLSEDQTLGILKEIQTICDQDGRSTVNLKIYSVADFLHENKYQSLCGKKRALQIGIDHSQFEFLVYTDADCLPSKEWLNEINRHIDDKTDFIVGYSPLIYTKPTYLDWFKSFERISIFALTSGSFGQHLAMTCTARNMIYRRAHFDKAGGFSQIGHIKSGDDDLMLLLQRQYTRKYNFMFTAQSVVPAIEDKDINDHIHQETRRASKLKYYPAYLKIIVISVAVFYLGLVLLLISSIAGLLSWQFFISSFGIKVIAEFLLIFTWLIRMNMKIKITLLPVVEILYIPYFLYFGIKGTFGSYKWKN